MRALQIISLIESAKQVSKNELQEIEKVLDRLFAKVGIDVEFTKHFYDRLNDKRNGEQISVSELVALYTDEFKKYGDRISKMKNGADALLTDSKSFVNVPVVLKLNKDSGLIEMTAKTIMRAKRFHTRSKRLVV